MILQGSWPDKFFFEVTVPSGHHTMLPETSGNGRTHTIPWVFPENLLDLF